MAEDAISIGGVDLADPDTYVSGMPFEAFRELRRRAPVAWHPYKDGPGFLALTGYDEVLAVSRDSATWSSQAAGVFFDVPRPEDEYQLSLMMLTMDPPRHTKLRSLVSKGFTPRQVARLNDHVADMARADRRRRGGAGRMRLRRRHRRRAAVVRDRRTARHSAGRRSPALRTDRDHEQRLGRRPGRRSQQTRRCRCSSTARSSPRASAQSPGDDIATSLLQAEVDGERLTDLEFNMFFLLLINAGGDTTRNLVAAGILALMEHPAEQARLAADPSLLPTAIEEMLRYTSPVTVFVRTATKDTELRGIPVKAGDRAAMFYPSANRDETRFADPDRFDIGRAPEPAPGLRRRRHPFLPRREPRPGGGHRDHSRGAVADDGPRARRAGRAGAVEPDERHPLDARPVHPGSRRG